MKLTPIQQEVIKKIFQSQFGIVPIAYLTPSMSAAIDIMDASKLIFKQSIMTHNGLLDVITLRTNGLVAYEEMEG